MPSPALTTPFPANLFPNGLTAKIPNNIERNSCFCSFLCSFVSLLIISIIPFINNPDPSNDSTIFVISSVFSFEIRHS